MIEEIYMISQLMTQLSKITKSEKISTGQGDDYTTACLLDFAYFEKKNNNNNNKLIAADLSK